MSNRCQSCNRMLLTASTICEICQSDTLTKLVEIPRLYAQASNELAPGRGGYGSSGSEMSIGVNINALDFLNAADLLGTLTAWEDMVREECSLTARQDHGLIEDRVMAVCEFLQTHMRYLSGHSAAGDFVREVAVLHSKGMGAARIIIEKPTRIKCPATIEMLIDEDLKQVQCNQFLVLTEDAEAKIECRRCGTVWTVARLLAVAVSTPGAHVMLDPNAVAGFLGMSVANVHVFAKRHGIEMVNKKYSLVAFVAKRRDERHADEGA